MDKETFDKCKNHLLREAAKVRSAKESEYFSTGDILESFKKIAAFRDKDTPEAIMNLVAKQLVSISDMINNEPLSLDPYPMEVWEEKFVDSLNYLFKLYASIHEARQ